MILSGVLALSALSSCDKDFLDQQPYTSIPTNNAFLTDADVFAALNGTYSGLQETDLYGRSILVLGDILANNTFVSTKNAGRYLEFENYTFSRNNGTISDLWSDNYRVITRANEIINSVQTEVSNQEDVDQYKGEAYAIRALAYFDLVRFFARPYTDSPSAPGVPLVLENDYTVKPSRNTVGEVYDQILSDLEKASTLMTSYSNSGRFSPGAATALAAKVNLFKGDYTTALAKAEDVIDNSGFALVPRESVLAYWANSGTAASKGETLFSVVFTEVDNNGSDEIADIYSQQGGYGDIISTKEVYDLYSSTDVRKDLIINGPRKGGEASAYIVNKFENVTGDRDDRVVLRMSEMYLIAAESAARLGDEETARGYLNALVAERDPSLVYTSTGEQLINDILLERTKELVFEGDKLHTLDRLKMDITGRPKSPTEVPYSDYRRVFPIPQSEIDANKNIEQNPNW